MKCSVKGHLTDLFVTPGSDAVVLCSSLLQCSQVLLTLGLMGGISWLSHSSATAALLRWLSSSRSFLLLFSALRDVALQVFSKVT